MSQFEPARSISEARGEPYSRGGSGRGIVPDRASSGRFEKGRIKTAGRVAGTPNRTTQAVKDALLHAFEEVGGQEWFIELAKSDPRTFALLLGTLIRHEFKVEGTIDGIPELRVVDYTGGKCGE